jgi:hypothetical protein
MPTAAEVIRPKPKAEANRWWARAAYNGKDRPAALAALASSGIPLKPVAGTKDLLSAMARGDALIKGAAGLAVPRRKGGAKSARCHRLLQRQLVTGYAGFEIFAEACVGRTDRVGLKPGEITALLSGLSLPPCIHIGPPLITSRSSQWLLTTDTEQVIDGL